jgi:hypothetical protein
MPANSQSMASGDLLITLCRVGSFRAGRHGASTVERNWKPVASVPLGIGPVLLHLASVDQPVIGYQDPDNLRWLDNENREVHPAFYCLIPQFDADDDGAAV